LDGGVEFDFLPVEVAEIVFKTRGGISDEALEL
jgi:hypothetical protein